MARPITVSVTLTADSANVIAHSQTPSGAGNLTLTASPVSLDAPRQVLITSAGDDHLVTFTVYGNQRIDGTGNAISEAVTGAAIGTAATQQSFGQVSRVAISAAAAGAVTVGTNTTGSSPWILMNYHAQPFDVGISVEVSGTVTYTVEWTNDNFLNPAVLPVTFADAVLNGLTVNGYTSYLAPVRGVRLTVTSGTGTATMTVIQAGIKG